MAILLPPDHPSERLSTPGSQAEGQRRVRIGIINVMPRLEVYEPSLLEPLSRTAELVEPVFVRLTSHAYRSSDHDHLDRFYVPLDRALAAGRLDGLILTGAPVEELPFEEVRYWAELTEILAYARENVTTTLGLCWGGLAIARMLGVEKRILPRKLFGVFEDRLLVDDHDILGRAPRFPCAHSRHSGVVERDLELAARAGTVRLLSRGERTGYSTFETPDHRYLAHLGHPEYEGARLAFEWNRDRAIARPGVDPPEAFDADAPTTPWRAHRETLFAGFAARVAGARPTPGGA